MPTVWANTLLARPGTCSDRPKRYSPFLKALISIIWNGEFAKKRRRPMAFKTLKTTREAISLSTLGKRIAERRIVVGAVDVPRNEGKRRTPSKQTLLDEIAKAGGQW